VPRCRASLDGGSDPAGVARLPVIERRAYAAFAPMPA
jgi:hypothetical protein